MSFKRLNSIKSKRTCQFGISPKSSCKTNAATATLYDSIPYQANEPDSPLVLDAARPLAVSFAQHAGARSGTSGDGEIAQVYSDGKKKALYGPMTDSDSVRYIDHVEWVKFAFYIERPGKYWRWQRLYFPKNSTWNHFESVDNGSPKELMFIKPKSGTWIWCKSPYEYELTQGLHFLEFSKFLGGKRLQAIVFTDDSNFVPSGTLPQTRSIRMNNAELITEPLFPETADSLSDVSMSWNGKGEIKKVAFFIGNECVKTFSPPFIGQNNDLSFTISDVTIEVAARSGISLKVQLSRSVDNTAPVIGLPVLHFSESGEKQIILKSGNAELLLSRESGRIVEAKLHHDSGETCSVSRPFSPMPVPRLLMKKMEKKGHWVGEDEITAFSVHTQKSEVTVEYAYLNNLLTVKTKVTTKEDGLYDLSAEIVNHSAEDVLEFDWPRLENIQIGSGEKDTLMLPRYEPELIEAPAMQGVQEEIYPHGSMCWIHLSDGDSGVYLNALDPELIITHLQCAPAKTKGLLSLGVVKKHRIKARNGVWRYQYQLAVHSGDWHWAADRYRAFFYTLFPVVQYPKWLVESNGFYEASLASVEWDLPEVQPPHYAKVAEHHLNRAWYTGVDHIQAWGQAAMDHACPTYYLPDPERGGEDAFKKMFTLWRKAGFHAGSYFHSTALNSFFAQADKIRGVARKDIPASLRPPNWKMFIENLDYPNEKMVHPKKLQKNELKKIEKHEAIIPRNYPRMSSFSEKWKKYIRTWINRYIKEYAHDVIYHDQLGSAPQRPEFNRYLGLHGEGNGARSVVGFIRKTAIDMSKLSPEFVQVYEALTDVLSVYAAAFTSGFHRNTEVYRYTFPDHILYYGHNNGMWKDPVQLQSIRMAFLEGLKFDIMRIKPDNIQVVWLRDSIRKWVFYGRYMHNSGLRVSNSDVTIRCFYRNNLNNEGLLLTLLDAKTELKIEWEGALYGDFKKALFINTDGDVRFLPLQNRQITIPACETGAVLLVRKTDNENSLFFKATSAENGQLHCIAANLSEKTMNPSFHFTEYDGDFEYEETVGDLHPGTVWEKIIPIPAPHPRRLLITTSSGTIYRRFIGKINGTYYGYPHNRKNLRFHYHPVPQKEIDRILREEY